MFVGLDGTIDSASAACRQMFGVEPEALVGLNSFDLIHPDDQARVLVALSSIPNLGDQVRVEFRVIDGTGGILWLEEIATNLVDDPDVGCVVSSLRDVTERVELLRRIETDRRRLAVAQASAKLGSVELNLDTGEVRQSDELCRMLGLEPGAEPGTDFEFVHADDRDRVREVVAETLAGRSQPECTFRIVRVDGEVRWVLAQASMLGTPDANVAVATMLDITDRYQAEMALAHQATHDWLTHLPNAPSLHNSLQSALSDADPSHLVAVALVDIDHFKLVNDRGGHALGDQVLRAVAARLKAELPSSDIVARVGGDEFVIVRAGVGTLDEAKELGVSAMALLREPVKVVDRDVQLTISVGVALSTVADSPDSLLRDVDDAMYQAKRDGKNRVTVFDHGARVRAHRRQSVAAALPLALARDELHLEYQPIVELATVETAGFEALLRWEHPDLGMIAPDEFIPIAEANGLILPIGAWVLERASQQLADWRADQQVPPELWIAINLSASQLAQPNLASQVQATIRRAGVPAAAIHLEIAENVLMDRIDNALNTIVELQAVGVSVSIDDFGTGYSSLSYLSRLPVDTIKIDRSFVSGLGGAGHGTSIIRATIALANTLNLHVVAEGVELPAQLDLLRELGCTYGQGFIWSRSLRPEAALKWMTEHTAALPPPNAGQLAARRTAIANAPVDVGQAIVAIAHTSAGRRRTPADLANILRFDSLEIGLNARKAWLAGRDLDLTVKEFDLLAFLTEHTGQVFSRTELLHEVWHSSPDWQNPATVTEHIHRLRSRIEPDPSRPRLISTVRGRGYCFGSEAVGTST